MSEIGVGVERRGRPGRYLVIRNGAEFFGPLHAKPYEALALAERLYGGGGDLIEVVPWRAAKRAQKEAATEGGAV